MIYIDKLPKDIKQKLQNNLNKISLFNSKELLEYSKDLKKLSEQLGKDVVDYLFNAIDERTKAINSGLDEKKVCELEEAVKQFKKRK
jgi:hypothetical protein